MEIVKIAKWSEGIDTDEKENELLKKHGCRRLTVAEFLGAETLDNDYLPCGVQDSPASPVRRGNDVFDDVRRRFVFVGIGLDVRRGVLGVKLETDPKKRCIADLERENEDLKDKLKQIRHVIGEEGE